MRIKLHTKAGEQLDRLGHSLATRQHTPARMARRLWEEFKQSLRDAKGPLPGSMACPEYGPDYWWVAFPPCYLALVRFRTTREFFGWLVRREAA